MVRQRSRIIILKQIMYTMNYGLVFVILQVSQVWSIGSVSRSKYPVHNQQSLGNDLAALRGLFAKERSNLALAKCINACVAPYSQSVSQNYVASQASSSYSVNSPSSSYGQTSDNGYTGSSALSQPSAQSSSAAGYNSYGSSPSSASNSYNSQQQSVYSNSGYSNPSPVSNSYGQQQQSAYSSNNHGSQGSSSSYPSQQYLNSPSASQSSSGSSSNYGQTSVQPALTTYTQVVTNDQTYPSSPSRDYSSQPGTALQYNTVPQIIPPSYTSSGSSDSSSNYGQSQDSTSSSSAAGVSPSSPSSGPSSSSSSSPSSSYSNDGFSSGSSGSAPVSQNSYSNSYSSDSQVKISSPNSGYESDSATQAAYQGSGYSSSGSSGYSSPSSQPYRSVYSITSPSGPSYKVATPVSQPISQVSSSYSDTQVGNEYYSDPECPSKDGQTVSQVQSNYVGQVKGVSSSTGTSSHVNPAPVKYSQTSMSSPASTAYQSTGKTSYGSSAVLSTSASSSQQSLSSPSAGSNIQSYDAEDLDPSKHDLKIVHLPVSVLKKLVGNGDASLKPNFHYQPQLFNYN